MDRRIPAETYQLHPYTGQPTQYQQMPFAMSNTDVSASTAVAPWPQRKRGLLSVLRRWITEFGAIIVAAAALLGIYEVLRMHDGQPLPKLPYQITLNTIVSLLSQALTVSIGIAIHQVLGQAKWTYFAAKPQRLIDFGAFDDAIRGPLGAVKLLLRPRIAFHSLAAATSLLTIVSLAVSPFTQQLLRYDTRALADGSATVPRSEVYDAWSNGVIAAMKNIDPAMKAAFYNGLYNGADAASKFAVSPTCITGNCTWPMFSSLAVCSQCVDSSASISRNCVSTASCVFTLSPSATKIIPVQGQAYTFNSTVTSSQIEGLPYYNSSLVRLQMLGSTSVTAAYAYSCDLYLCVNTYQTSVASGNFTETVTTSFPNASTSSLDSKIVGEVTANPVHGVYQNVTFVPGADDGVIGGPYNVHGISAVPLQSFLASGLEGTGVGGGATRTPSSDNVQALWNAAEGSLASLSLLIAGVAASLTNTMRVDTISTGSKLLDGTAWVNETYVSVQWVWILLPMALVVLSLLVLVATVSQTYGARIESLKGEGIATLFVGLTEEKREVIDHTINTTDDMKKAAENMTVRLQPYTVKGEYRLG